MTFHQDQHDSPGKGATETAIVTCCEGENKKSTRRHILAKVVPQWIAERKIYQLMPAIMEPG